MPTWMMIDDALSITSSSNTELTSVCIDGRNERTRHTTRARSMAGANAHGMCRKIRTRYKTNAFMCLTAKMIQENNKKTRISAVSPNGTE